MSKISIVLEREFLQYVSTKGYKISTLITPLFMIAIFLIPRLLLSSKGTHQTIGIKDTNRQVFDYLVKSREKNSPFTFKWVIKDAIIKEEMARNKLNAILSLPDQSSDPTKSIVLFSYGSVSRINVLKSLVQRAIINYELENKKISRTDRERILTPLSIVTKVLNNKKSKSFYALILPYVLAMIIYMTLILNGIAVMRSVVEEKSSRLVDIVISSIRPFDLMMGKILGIGLAAFLQIAIWISTALILVLLLPFLKSWGLVDFNSISLSQLPWVEICFFIIFFILGFLLYASLYAMIGSFSSNEAEANQMQMPVTFLLVIPIVLMSAVIESPDSLFSIVMSLVPFFSPILMFLRINVADPSFLQIVLSLLNMILLLLLVVWLAGRLYRVGILMTGKWPGLKKMIRLAKIT